MANKFILVTKKEVAEEICDEIGTNYMLQDLNGQTMYCFVNTDRLHKLLSNKGRFSKRDWFTGGGMLKF